MAVSYAASHPDLPGEGITPTPGLESSKSAFEPAASPAPTLSPYEASQAQQTDTGQGVEQQGVEQPSRRQSFAERARNADKPRDPMPRLEPDGRTVRQVHAAVRNGRMGPPPIRKAPARTVRPVPPQAIVSPVPYSKQERDLSAAMRAFDRMQGMSGAGNDLDQSLKTGRSRS